MQMRFLLLLASLFSLYFTAPIDLDEAPSFSSEQPSRLFTGIRQRRPVDLTQPLLPELTSRFTGLLSDTDIRQRQPVDSDGATQPLLKISSGFTRLLASTVIRQRQPVQNVKDKVSNERYFTNERYLTKLDEIAAEKQREIEAEERRIKDQEAEKQREIETEEDRIKEQEAEKQRLKEAEEFQFKLLEAEKQRKIKQEEIKRQEQEKRRQDLQKLETDAIEFESQTSEYYAKIRSCQENLEERYNLFAIKKLPIHALNEEVMPKIRAEAYVLITLEQKLWKMFGFAIRLIHILNKSKCKEYNAEKECVSEYIRIKNTHDQFINKFTASETVCSQVVKDRDIKNLTGKLNLLNELVKSLNIYAKGAEPKWVGTDKKITDHCYGMMLNQGMMDYGDVDSTCFAGY